MATIGNVNLTIVQDQQTGARLRVSYNALGDAQDVTQHRTYVETIELFGVDEGAGEDGQNELIPGGRVVNLFSFQAATTPRSREILVASLDEDKFPNGLPIPLRDEIRARVTLAPAGPSPVSRDSNLVTRGGILNSVAVPA
ncbi:MAG TPA: hypothetical protein VFQ67_17870 [Allosphingosinicella sp.]|jgi:hypothetical protein|nr:hypothetical protein [Allosphingosinicella sp.]